jgi:hypothetical protein
MLVIYIFYLLVYTGKDPENPDQTFLDIMEGSDSYAALLWGKDISSLILLIALKLSLTPRHLVYTLFYHAPIIRYDGRCSGKRF